MEHNFTPYILHCRNSINNDNSYFYGSTSKNGFSILSSIQFHNLFTMPEDNHD